MALEPRPTWPVVLFSGLFLDFESGFTSMGMRRHLFSKAANSDLLFVGLVGVTVHGLSK